MHTYREHRLRRDGLTWSDLGDEVVILDLRSSTYFSARGTAATLVSELVAGASTDALVARIVADYETTEDTARDDVDAFVRELHDRELLER